MESSFFIPPVDDADYFKRYRAEVLDPYFLKQDYASALPVFQAFLPYAPRAKEKATLYVNIVKCDWFGHLHQWSLVHDAMREYSQLLHDNDAKNWPVQPAIEVFEIFARTTLRFFSPTTEHASAHDLLEDLFAQLPIQFHDAYLQGISQAFEQEASNYEEKGHEHRAQTLGRLYLALTDATPAQPGINIPTRVAIRNRMADLLVFHDAQSATKIEEEAILLLSQSLLEDPTNCFALQLKEHIAQRAAFRLQIDRFFHDANSHLAPAKQMLANLRKEQNLSLELRDTLASIQRNISWVDTALRISGSAQGSHVVAQPESDLFQSVDPADFCLDILKEAQVDGKLQTEGEPRKWELVLDYTRLALHNLIANSQEAYIRRGIPKPSHPIELSIDYAKGTLMIRDYAGGINASIPDPFLPFVSEKGVHMRGGLGLIQARDAIEQQDGKLTLCAQQPGDGALFMIQFSEF